MIAIPPGTETPSKELQFDVSFTSTVKKVVIIVAGILFIWFFKDRKKGTTVQKVFHWFANMAKREDKSLKEVYWIDERENEVSGPFFKEFKKKAKKTSGYKFHRDTASKVPTIVVCQISTDRYESCLDACLRGIQVEDYGRTMVILIQPSADKYEPKVSTKKKLEVSNRYKDLKHVIDVRFTKREILPNTLEVLHGVNLVKEVRQFLSPCELEVNPKCD